MKKAQPVLIRDDIHIPVFILGQFPKIPPPPTMIMGSVRTVPIVFIWVWGECWSWWNLVINGRNGY